MYGTHHPTQPTTTTTTTTTAALTKEKKQQKATKAQASQSKLRQEDDGNSNSNNTPSTPSSSSSSSNKDLRHWLRKADNRTRKWLDMLILYRSLTQDKRHTANSFPTHTPLGQWIQRQRQEYAQQKLSTTQLTLLKAADFDFAIASSTQRRRRQRQGSWDTMYRDLRRYQERHGHCNVPKSQGTLGVWVQEQRYLYRLFQQEQQEQTDKHADTLATTTTTTTTTKGPKRNTDSLIDRMNAKKQQQQQHIQQQAQNATMPTFPSSPNTQPSSRMTFERVEALNQLDFQWTVKSKQRSWEDNYRELAEFYIANGHTNVTSRHGDRRLLEWIQRQRVLYAAHQRASDSGRIYATPATTTTRAAQSQRSSSNGLTMERIARLNRMGFRWEDPRYVAWKDAFRELTHYFCAHGHTNVVPQQNYYLYRWVQQQRLFFAEWMKERVGEKALARRNNEYDSKSDEVSSSSSSSGPRHHRRRRSAKPPPNNMSEERVQLLLSINFCFDPVEAQFWNQYEKMRHLEAEQDGRGLFSAPGPANDNSNHQSGPLASSGQLQEKRWGTPVRGWVQKQREMYRNDGNDVQKWWVYHAKNPSNQRQEQGRGTAHNDGAIQEENDEDATRLFRWPQEQFDHDQRIGRLQERMEKELHMLTNRTEELRKMDCDEVAYGSRKNNHTTTATLQELLSDTTPHSEAIRQELDSRLWERLVREYRKIGVGSRMLPKDQASSPFPFDTVRTKIPLLTPDRLIKVDRIVMMRQQIARCRRFLQERIRLEEENNASDEGGSHVAMKQSEPLATNNNNSNNNDQKQEGNRQPGRQRQLLSIVETQPITSDLAWEDLILPLLEYHAEHQHCRVPLDHPTLTPVCDKLRQRYARYVRGKTATSSSLTLVSPRIERRLQQLEAIGFVWDRRDQKWFDRCQEMFDQSSDGTRVGSSTTLRQDPSLHRWWITQTRRYNRQLRGETGLLTPLQVSMLEELGIRSNKGAAALLASSSSTTTTTTASK